MRPARAGRPGQGAGGSTNGGKLHSLIGAVWGGQETNPDFTNPGGHDFNDANFDANAQLPFEKQSFADRLMGRPDANQAYTLNRAAAAGALTDAQKLALFQQNLAHQEQTFQENKLGSDLALLAQQQNAGRLNPSLSRPSLSYDLSSGTPQAESPFPVMSPQEYNLMLGSQARQIGIPAAQALQAHAINARIGTEAMRPYVAPTSAFTGQAGESDARRGALESSLALALRQSPAGAQSFTSNILSKEASAPAAMAQLTHGLDVNKMILGQNLDVDKSKQIADINNEYDTKMENLRFSHTSTARQQEFANTLELHRQGAIFDVLRGKGIAATPEAQNLFTKTQEGYLPEMSTSGNAAQIASNRSSEAENRLNADFLGTPEGTDLYTNAAKYRYLQPQMNYQISERSLPTHGMVHFGNGMVFDTFNNRAYSGIPPEKPGQWEMGMDSKGKQTMQKGKGSPGQLQISYPSVNDPSFGGQWRKSGGAGAAPLRDDSRFGVGSGFQMDQAQDQPLTPSMFYGPPAPDPNNPQGLPTATELLKRILKRGANQGFDMFSDFAPSY